MYFLFKLFFLCLVTGHACSSETKFRLKPFDKFITDAIKESQSVIEKSKHSAKGIFGKVPKLVDQTVSKITDSFQQAAEAVATGTAKGIIAGASAFIKSQGKDTIELKNLHKSCHFGLSTLDATEGKMKNFASLALSGRVSLMKSGKSLFVFIPICMKELEVSYDKFKLSGLGIKLTGKIKASVNTNELLLKLHLLSASDCIIKLEGIDVLKLDDINIDLGTQARKLSDVITFLTNSVKDTIRNSVQQNLDDFLSSYVNSNSNDICLKFLK